MREHEFPSLSGIEFFVIQMLLERGEMFGLEIIDASNGRLKKGSIYVTLGRMEKKGLLESYEKPRADNEFGANRRIYRTSNYGKRLFKAQEIALKYLDLGSW